MVVRRIRKRTSNPTPEPSKVVKEPINEPNIQIISSGKYGPYTILGKLGSGGMGEVVKVRDVNGKERALKLIKTKIDDEKGKDMLKRFIREINAMREINHPNTVRIVDVDINGQNAFYVMELMNSNDLKVELDKRGRKPFPNETAIQYICQVIDGVYAAHEKGILHRDLKPANIFMHKVSGQYVIKVADFGLAKFTGEEDDLTATMAVMGTPKYMAPELLGGMKKGSEKSDQYAIGIILYELLTGQTPYNAQGFLECLAEHKKGECIPPRAINNEISKDLERIIKKAMEVNPKDRFSNLLEMKEAILAEKSFDEPKSIKQSVMLEEEVIEIKRNRNVIFEILKYGSIISVLAGLVTTGLIFKKELAEYYTKFQANINVGINSQKLTRIKTDPPGAEVFDSSGEKIGNTDKPLEIELKEGSNVLTIKKDGYKTKRIVVKGSQGDLTLKLEK